MARSKFNPQYHHRRSIRLKGYDYSRTGAYFVTICTRNRKYLFGDIVDGDMRLNEAGRMVRAVWDEIPSHYSGAGIDAFIAMPNHIHGIIAIAGATVGAGPRACPIDGPRACHDREGQPRGVAPTGLALPDVVHRFKTMTTKRYTDGVKQHGWVPFDGKLWHRNYYEHIIRNDDDLARIRKYIHNNPAKW